MYKSRLFFALLITFCLGNMYGAHKSAFGPYKPVPFRGAPHFSHSVAEIESPSDFNSIDNPQTFIMAQAREIYVSLVRAIQSHASSEKIDTLLQQSPIPLAQLLNQKHSCDSIKDTPLGAAISACKDNPDYTKVISDLMKSGAVFTDDVDQDTGCNYLSLVVEHWPDIQNLKYIIIICQDCPKLLYTIFRSATGYMLTPLLYAQWALKEGNSDFTAPANLLRSYHYLHDEKYKHSHPHCTAENIE